MSGMSGHGLVPTPASDLVGRLRDALAVYAESRACREGTVDLDRVTASNAAMMRLELDAEGLLRAALRALPLADETYKRLNQRLMSENRVIHTWVTQLMTAAGFTADDDPEEVIRHLASALRAAPDMVMVPRGRLKDLEVYAGSAAEGESEPAFNRFLAIENTVHQWLAAAPSQPAGKSK